MNSFLLHLLSPHPSVWSSVPRPQPRQGSERLTLQNYSKFEHGLPLRGEKNSQDFQFCIFSGRERQVESD